MSVNDDVLDATIGHSVDLTRLESNLGAKVTKELKALEKSLTKALSNSDIDVGNSVLQRKRMAALLAQTKKTISDSYKAIAEMQDNNLATLAKVSEGQAVDIINTSMKASVVSMGMSEQTLGAIASNTLIEGAPSREWWSGQKVGLQKSFKNTIRQSMLAGETTSQIVAKVRGTKALGYKDGIMQSARSKAQALVRTSVQTVANEARMRTYAQNDDIVKGVQWVATLDGRTSSLCQQLDGKRWDTNKQPINHSMSWQGPTAHWNCRSTQIAILKSWEELDSKKKFNEVPESTRASMDGQVAAGQNYEQWLETKDIDFQKEVLGAKKWDLWRKGKLVPKDLVDQSSNPLSLKAIEEKVNAIVPTHTPPTSNEINDLAIPYKKLREEINIEQDKLHDVWHEQNRLNKIPNLDNAIYQANLDQERIIEAKMAKLRSKERKLRNEARSEAKKMIKLPKKFRASSPYIGKIPAEAAAEVEDSLDFLTSVLHKKVNPRVKTSLIPKNKEQRAHYSFAKETIYLAKNESVSTIIHEVIHDLENRYPRVLEKTEAFLKKRAGNQKPQKLSKLTGDKRYRANEIAYEDKFQKLGGSHYEGKIYKGATELLSMGAERLYENPLLFAQQDPEYFDFVMEVFHGL